MALPPVIEYNIADWQTFIKKVRQYKWHGLIQSCVKDFYFVSKIQHPLLNITPPIYYKYNFTGSESRGGLSIYPKKINYRHQKLTGGNFQWYYTIPSPLYDTLQLDWFVDIPEGCFVFSGGSSGFETCVYGTFTGYDIIVVLQQTFGGYVSSSNRGSFYFTSHENFQSFIWKYNSLLHQYICLSDGGSINNWLSLYFVSFKQNPSSGNYDVWSSMGDSFTDLKNPVIHFNQYFHYWRQYGGSYPSCFYNFHVFVDSVVAYSGLF